jgi:hypothetical protein
VNSPGPRHAALRGTESGCLAIADISGYTAYLAGAELDHAQGVLEDLTETVGVAGLVRPSLAGAASVPVSRYITTDIAADSLQPGSGRSVASPAADG